MLDIVLKKSDSHNIQDSGLVEIVKIGNVEIPTMVISDGCSSGINTEFGSMLISLSFMSVMKENSDILDFKNPALIYEKFLRKFSYSCLSLKIEVDMALATLNAVYVFEGKIYHIMAGDGFLFYKKKEEVFYYRHFFESNAPYYPAYKIFNKEKEYEQSFEKNNRIIERTAYITGDVVDSHHWGKNVHIREHNIDDISYLGISSDGIESFQNNGNSFDYYEICKEMCDIKNSTGSFVQRTFNRVNKNLTKLEYSNYDDVSIAMMIL
jgi:hypothetical protein